MRIHLLSDIHLERTSYRPPRLKVDVVLAAGDIGEGVEGVIWAKEVFPNVPVLYVPGNHEYHNKEISVPQILAAMRREAEGSNVIILDRDECVIDGCRFLGATLWSDFSIEGQYWRNASMQHAIRNIEDFSKINAQPGQLITPSTTVSWHERDLRWLKFKLREPFAGHTIVITHHACVPQSLPEKSRGNLVNGWFSSDLTEELGRCSLWVHGHIHRRIDQLIHDTRVISNPRGEAGEGFDSRLVLTL